MPVARNPQRTPADEAGAKQRRNFGVIAFLLALAYRSWVLNDDDDVEDDVEDRRIAREAHHDVEVEVDT